MKHALRIAAHIDAAHPVNLFPMASGQRLRAVLRDVAASTSRSTSPRTMTARTEPDPASGFSPLVHDFLDECGYSEK